MKIQTAKGSQYSRTPQDNLTIDKAFTESNKTNNALKLASIGKYRYAIYNRAKIANIILDTRNNRRQLYEPETNFFMTQRNIITKAPFKCEIQEKI